MLVQNPEQPNLIFGQQDSEFDFRPPRYIMTQTGPLESAGPISKYIVILPADRKFMRHVYGMVLTTCVMSTLSLLVFLIGFEDKLGRMSVPCFLMMVLFLAKLSFYGGDMPQVREHTIAEEEGTSFPLCATDPPPPSVPALSLCRDAPFLCVCACSLALAPVALLPFLFYV